jgi:thiamine biosynthesis lipoprotein
MHPTRAGSDLARLNAGRAGERITVHPWTSATLQLCRKLHELSGGLFDPALPGMGSITDVLPVDPTSVRLTRATRLDLGGIAKGYAVDRAIQCMKAEGAHAGLVNAGGDLRVYGAQPWPIRLRLAERIGSPLALCNAALAVSDPAAFASPPEHQGYYARATGLAATALPCVAVRARSAALADGMTKVLMLAPAAQRAALLRRTRTRLIAIDISTSG